jgi:hypothetical protein
MKTTATKLAELGTTGIIQFVNTGSLRLRGTRLAKAIKIIETRHGSPASREAFCNAVSADFRR